MQNRPHQSLGAWLAKSPDTRSIMLQATGVLHHHSIDAVARINVFNKQGRPSVVVITVQLDDGILDDDGDLLAYELDLSLCKFLRDTDSQEFIRIQSKGSEESL